MRKYRKMPRLGALTKDQVIAEVERLKKENRERVRKHRAKTLRRERAALGKDESTS